MSNDDVPTLPLAFTKLMEDFQRSFQNFERLHDMQRKNMEALIELNQISIEAVQSFARRQADIMRRTTDVFAAAAIDMMGAKSPAEIAQRQLAVTKDAFLMTQSELKALAHMTAAARRDATRVYAERVTDSLDQLDMAKPKE
jgi:phasin family protein